jgi:hypothetical protein
MHTARHFYGSYINVQNQEDIIMKLNTTRPSTTSFMKYRLLRLISPETSYHDIGRSLLTFWRNIHHLSSGRYQIMWHQNPQDFTVTPTRNSNHLFRYLTNPLFSAQLSLIPSIHCPSSCPIPSILKMSS